MTPQERDLIMAVAKRLRGGGAPQKEPEADALIRQEIGNQPDALYVLTQAVIVQEFGLKQAKERVTQLEKEVQQARSQPQAPQKGGFLGGLLGGEGAAPVSRATTAQSVPRASGAQSGSAPAASGGGFGDFMKSAASMAVGVAGGHMLFQGLSNMFGDSPKSEESGNLADAGQIAAADAVPEQGDPFAQADPFRETDSSQSNSFLDGAADQDQLAQDEPTGGLFDDSGDDGSWDDDV